MTKRSEYVFLLLIARALQVLNIVLAFYVVNRNVAQAGQHIVYLIYGLSVWAVLFEIGIPQKIQNRILSRKEVDRYSIRILLKHFGLISTAAALILYISMSTNGLWLIKSGDQEQVEAVSVGLSCIALFSVVQVIQKFLFAVNPKRQALYLVLIGLTTSLGLMVFWMSDAVSLRLAILAYFTPGIFLSIIYLFTIAIIFSSRVLPKTDKRTEHKGREGGLIGYWFLSLLSTFATQIDFILIALYLDLEVTTVYYLVTRLFYIAYAVYYPYTALVLRGLYSQQNQNIENSIKMIKRKNLLIVGIFSIVSVLFFAVDLKKYLVTTSDVGVGLIITSSIYYLLRSVRDVEAQYLVNEGAIRIGLICFLTEIIAVTALFGWSLKSFGLYGLFLAQACSSLAGLLILSHYRRYRRG